MSNAMRSGKRLLAGVAAGALGAGVLAFVAAPPAVANTAASIAFQWPSATVVGTGWATDDTVLFPIKAFDAGGVPATNMTGFRVDVVTTKPAFVTDDSIGFNNGANATVSKNLSITDFSQLSGTGIGLIGATATWNSAVSTTFNRQGTYTITATLVNTASGAAVSTSTATFQLVTNEGAPAATVTYLSGPALAYKATLNPINQLGTTAFTNTGGPGLRQTVADSIAVGLTDAKGGPYVTADDSILISNGGTADDSLVGGWAKAQSNPLVYTLDDTLPAWGGAGTGRITTTVYNTGVAVAANAVGTGALPVEIAGVVAAKVTTPPDAILGNTLSYYVSDDVYEVPTGTTALNFTVLTSNSLDDTTLQWDAWSNVSGGSVVPSGGRVAMRADAGAVALTVPAAATTDDDSVSFTVGPNGTGTQDTVQVIFADPAATPSASPGIAKLGDAAPIPGTITDQFGRALPGTWTVTLRATSSTSAAVLATATADAAGAFTITAPASASPATAGDKTFYLFFSNGLGSPISESVPVTYTATGGVTSLTLSTPATISGVTATVRPLIRVPRDGTAVLTQTAAVAAPTTVFDDTIVNAASQALLLQATVAPGAVVTFSGSDGVLFSDRPAGSVFYANATKTYTPAAPSTTPQVWAISTKPGLNTVTATAGTSTATYTFYSQVASNAGRTMTVEPTSMTVSRNEFKSMEVSVKDIFGNDVPRNSGIVAALAGGGSLTGGQASVSLTTNALGKASVFYTAPNGTGAAIVEFTGASGNWVTGAVAGAPDVVRTARTNITVTDAPTAKAVVIAGSRGTVSGKPGIIVDGVVTNIANGLTVTPFIRFPGQTTFTAGSARPVIENSEFVWQRKTGKRVTVYVEADGVNSNRITIQAN